MLAVVATVLGLGVLLAAGWFWRGTDSAPIGSPSAMAGSEQPVAVAKVKGDQLEREAVAANDTRTAVTTGIRGRLLHSDGQPAEGWTVALCQRPLRLTRTVSHFEGPKFDLVVSSQTTPTDGSFTFADLKADQYEVRCAEWPANAKLVFVRIGTWHDLELQLPPDVVAVTGTLWQDGELDQAHRVRFYQGGKEVVERGFSGDGIHCALKPGQYQARVVSNIVSGNDVYLAEHALVVPVGARRVRWTGAVGGTICEILVRGGLDRAAHILGIDVNGTAAIGGGEGTHAENSTVGAVARVRLPPGRWRLHVHGPTVAALPEREVLVECDTPLVRLEFDALPAVPVTLRLRDHRGANVAVAPELMPSLQVGDVARACGTLGKAGAGGSFARLVFGQVPPGAAELRLEDRLVDGMHVFLPFEPMPKATLTAIDGATNSIDLTVQRRAFLDVRACDASGREDGTACVEVFLGEQRVRGRAQTFSQRWAAWLPAGDYRIVIDRNGVVREHTVKVAGADQALRLRP